MGIVGDPALVQDKTRIGDGPASVGLNVCCDAEEVLVSLEPVLLSTAVLLHVLAFIWLAMADFPDYAGMLRLVGGLVGGLLQLRA